MKHIVLVDDDESIHEIFQIVFDDKYKVTSFDNGDSILNRRAIVPDLFVLDTMRFGGAGLDLCRFIKVDALYRDVPVMILSATRNIQVLGKAAGADIVIEKPFCLKNLQHQTDLFIA